jgi:hypothetical protein
MTSYVPLTPRVRKRLSIAAWGAALFCAVILLFAAHDLAEHRNDQPHGSASLSDTVDLYTANNAR